MYDEYSTSHESFTHKLIAIVKIQLVKNKTINFVNET